MVQSPFYFSVPGTSEKITIDFFTSDQHLGHGREAERRGFEVFPYPCAGVSASKMMDDYICEMWKDVITDDHTVMLVGDITGGFHPADFLYSMRTWKNLPGRKFLIPGNWDQVFVRHYGEEVYAHYAPLYEQAGIHILPDEVLINYTSPTTGENHPVLVAHHPYLPQEWAPEDDMFYTHPSYHPRNTMNIPLIYGHIHQGIIPSSAQCTQFHVGVDAHDLKPVSSQTVGAWMESEVLSPQREQVPAAV